MAKTWDRWHKTYPKPGDAPCGCGTAAHPLYPTARPGTGDRWQVRWRDGKEQRSQNFARKPDAERHLARLGATWCLVPRCGNSAVTEPPVLLCADHRDLLIAQATRKRPAVHAPVVYFLRNGNRIKIGWTTNLKGRLSSLALPDDCVALTIPGGPVEEDALHSKFARARVGRSDALSPAIRSANPASSSMTSVVTVASPVFRSTTSCCRSRMNHTVAGKHGTRWPCLAATGTRVKAGPCVRHRMRGGPESRFSTGHLFRRR